MMLKKILQRLRLLLKAGGAPVMYVGGGESLPPPLSKGEEEACILALKEGDPQARKTLIERNLRLVVYVAKRFENTGVGIEDLVGIDLPDDQVNQLIEGIKAKIKLDKLGGMLGGLFGKK